MSIHGKKWSMSETNFLLENEALGYMELSKRLGRSYEATKAAIYRVRRNNGIKIKAIDSLCLDCSNASPNLCRWIASGFCKTQDDVKWLMDGKEYVTKPDSDGSILVRVHSCMELKGELS